MEIYDKKSFNMNGPYCRFKIRKCCCLLSNGGEKYGLAERRTGAGGGAFCHTRNTKGLREPERNGCLTPVELY